MDDTTAIQTCQDGDKEAFRHLVERYQRQAVGHAVALLGSREDARDAVQEAFVDAFRSLEKFDGSRRFYPWFYVLLRNRCFKAMSRRRETESVEVAEILVSTPENRLETIALESALRSLSSEEREIVILKYLDGLSYDQLAEQLQIPKGTVMSRLFYARKKLHAKLTTGSIERFKK